MIFKTTSYFLLFIFTVISTFQPHPTKAQTTPVPGGPNSVTCSYSTGSVGGFSKSIITCKMGGNQAKFEHMQTQTSEALYNKYKSDSSISNETEFNFWRLVGVPSAYKRNKIFLLTYEPISGSQKIVDIIAKVEDGQVNTPTTDPGVTIPSVANPSKDTVTNALLSHSQFTKFALGSSPLAFFILASLCDTESLSISGYAFGVGSRYDEFEHSVNLVDAIINSNLGIIVLSGNTKAKSSTIEQCKDYHIKPDINDARVKNAFRERKQKIIIEIEKADATDTQKVIVTNQLNSVFDDPSKIIKDEDVLNAYHKYYASNPELGYPDIALNSQLLTKFREENQAIYNKQYYAGTVGFLRSNFITKATDNAYIDMVLKEELKLVLSYTFLKQNAEFRKCAIEKDDTSYAGLTNDDINVITQAADSLIAATDSSAATKAEVASGDKTVCDNIDDGPIMGLLGKSLCGLALIIKNWADNFFDLAVSWMNASLGIKGQDVPS